MSTIMDQDCLDALGKWARRVLSTTAHEGPEERRAPRQPVNTEVVLLPLDNETLQPQLDRKMTAVTKDISDFGLGVVCNHPLADRLYFAQLAEGGVLLVRRVRGRKVLGAVHEYGFMVLDHYTSFSELRGNP